MSCLSHISSNCTEHSVQQYFYWNISKWTFTIKWSLKIQPKEFVLVKTPFSTKGFDKSQTISVDSL